MGHPRMSGGSPKKAGQRGEKGSSPVYMSQDELICLTVTLGILEGKTRSLERRNAVHRTECRGCGAEVGKALRTYWHTVHWAGMLRCGT